MANSVWSLGKDVDLGFIRGECQALVDLEEEYKKQGPQKSLKKYRTLRNTLVLIGIICFFFFLFIHGIILIIVGNILYQGVKLKRKAKVKDLIKFEVSKYFGWFYEPNKSKTGWKEAKENAPEIFKKGNSDQYFDDQFYGKIYSKGKSFDFHSGIFHYAMKNDKSTSHYYRNFFAFKLDKKLRTRFLLFPENVFSRAGKFINGKQIDVESARFNKKFAFSYNGKKNDKRFDIVKIISPAMQLKLLEMAEKRGDFRVLFSRDFVVFIFNGIILNRLKTDYSKDFKIHPGDINRVKGSYSELVEIIQEIAGKLH